MFDGGRAREFAEAWMKGKERGALRPEGRIEGELEVIGPTGWFTGLAGKRVGDARSCVAAAVAEADNTEGADGTEDEVPIPPRLDTATTCLTRFSNNTIRSLSAAFSARNPTASSVDTTSSIGVAALSLVGPDREVDKG